MSSLVLNILPALPIDGISLIFQYVPVNGTDFIDGKLKTPESGFNTVQLPALEVNANGTKYYVLHTDNKVLYFNDRGESINRD